MDIEMKILKKAREIITPKERWAKGFLAKDRNNYPVSPTSFRAICFCAEGAIGKASDLLQGDLGSSCSEDQIVHAARIQTRATDMLDSEVFQAYGMHVSDWNDHSETTHEDVLDMFDRAIARAQDIQNPAEHLE